ncbi:MAG: hypothetical protein JWQ87_1030 [Candidatus Sulfotelmatobacter sp.]|nr:hypothetical protein [Candidatus Sulfotelmatobacter sp.]
MPQPGLAAFSKTPNSQCLPLLAEHGRVQFCNFERIGSFGFWRLRRCYSEDPVRFVGTPTAMIIFLVFGGNGAV